MRNFGLHCCIRSKNARSIAKKLSKGCQIRLTYRSCAATSTASLIWSEAEGDLIVIVISM